MDRPVEITRSYADCKMCMDMCDQIPDCDLCKKPKGTWVDTITNMFGTKAVVVLEDGKDHPKRESDTDYRERSHCQYPRGIHGCRTVCRRTFTYG